MCVEDNQPQDCHNDRQRYASRIQNNVIQNYVHNYWSKEHKTERHEPIHKQQCTAYDLQRSNYPKVMRQYECANKLSREP